MREEFQQTLKETASSMQTKDGNSSDSEENSEHTVIGSESFPQLVWTHQQHWADYVHISAEEGIPLTLGEDRAAPLVTKVQFLLSRFSIFYGHPSFPYSNSYSASSLYSFTQALQNI